SAPSKRTPTACRIPATATGSTPATSSSSEPTWCAAFASGCTTRWVVCAAARTSPSCSATCRPRPCRRSPACASARTKARTSRSSSIAVTRSTRPATRCAGIIRSGTGARAHRRPERARQDTQGGDAVVKIHEYQGKEIFRRYGVPVPRGIPAFSVDDAVKAAQSLGGPVWVVKAQIHAGGRGKGGGVKLARSIGDVGALAQQMLGMNLVTHQTGPGGQTVRRLLIEDGADIRKELYAAMVVDRTTQRVVLMASADGGMDIEEVAAKTPERIHRVTIDPRTGLTDAQADDVARKIGIPD